MIRKEPIRMNIERAVLFTESTKQTEGENLSLRWAKALMHIAENIKLYVEPDGPSLLQLRGAEKRPVSPFVMSEEDLQVVEEVLYPYWKEGSYAQAYAQALPEETRKIIFGDDRNNFSKQQYVLSQSTTARSSSNFNYDLETILKRGMKSFQDEAEARLAEVKAHPKDYVKYGAFWEAAILCCQAFTIYAHRYAMETRRVAETVQSQTRRAELLEIADNCEWVATNPARDFRSALQLQWFVMAFVRLEQMNGASLGNARMDQHLLPYYQQDIASGKLTRAQAKELLECYWLNLSQITLVPTSESSSKLFEAYAHFETVTIGGQTKDGADATNELSYLILESKQGFPTTYPDLAVRVHAGSPKKFLRACRDASTDINDYVPNSIREAFVGHIGYATMIDSIAAVKKVVYDDKSVTMDELIKALDANFEGYEVVQQLLINAPKYGNNDPYADNIGKQIDHFVCEYLAQNPGVHGESFSMRVVPVTFHIPSGKVTGATPSGWYPLFALGVT